MKSIPWLSSACLHLVVLCFLFLQVIQQPLVRSGIALVYQPVIAPEYEFEELLEIEVDIIPIAAQNLDATTSSLQAPAERAFPVQRSDNGESPTSRGRSKPNTGTEDAIVVPGAWDGSSVAGIEVGTPNDEGLDGILFLTGVLLSRGDTAKRIEAIVRASPEAYHYLLTKGGYMTWTDDVLRFNRGLSERRYRPLRRGGLPYGMKRLAEEIATQKPEVVHAFIDRTQVTSIDQIESMTREYFDGIQFEIHLVE